MNKLIEETERKLTRLAKLTEETQIKDEILESLYKKNELFKKNIKALDASLKLSNEELKKKEEELANLRSALDEKGTKESPTFTTINNFILPEKQPTKKSGKKVVRLQSNLLV